MEETRYPLGSLRWLVPSAVGLALLVRLPLFLTTDFPLNDGGFSLSMIQDLLASHLRLPAFTTYNGGSIPFVYPPLGLYVAAVLARIGMADPVALVRYLPLLVNLATVAAFCFLALEVLGQSRATILAALLFPLLPFSFQWVTMGAGVTRTFGFFFAVLAATFAHRFAVRGGTRPAVLATIAASAALLSHLEGGVFALASMALFVLLYRRDRSGFAHLLAIALGVASLTAPWWGLVLARHGLAPFVGASGTSGWSDTFFVTFFVTVGTFVLTAEPLLSLSGVLAAVGLFAELARGRWLLPAWTFVTLVVVPRSAHTSLTVPLGLAAGVALGEVILPALQTLSKAGVNGSAGVGGKQVGRFRRVLPVAFTIWVLGYGLLSNAVNFSLGRAGTRCLAPTERSAMAWVAEHTAATSTFVVISPVASWSTDAALEWLPTLGARRCLNTPQGAEWLPAGEYGRRQELYSDLKSCNDLACLEKTAARAGVRFTHVYFSKAQTGPAPVADLWAAMRQAKGWRLVFDNGGASVFGRIPGGDLP